MKNLFQLLCFVLLTLNANCQTLPLNSLDEPNTRGHLKDMDNVLPHWVGTWKGISNNKEYTFQFITFPEHLYTFPSGNYHYRDYLKGKFKVVDLTNNQVLYNDLTVTNFEDYKISLMAYGNNIGYVFSFRDNEAHCYNFAKFTLLKNPSNPNQITYAGFEYYELLDASGCQYGQQQNIPMFLPKVTLTLTRQP